MPSTDFPDWTQAVAVREAVQQVTFPGSGGITPGDPAFVIDTSESNSVALQVLPPLTTAGRRYALQMIWDEDANPVEWETITFHDLASYPTIQPELLIRRPVRGSSLLLSAKGDSPQLLGIIGYKSTRQIAQYTPNPPLIGGGRMLYNASLGSLAAGATSAIQYVPPAARAVRIRVNQHLASMSITVNAVTVINGAVTIVTMLSADTTQNWNQQDEVLMPGLGMEVTITNGDTVAHATTLSVMDVS